MMTNSRVKGESDRRGDPGEGVTFHQDLNEERKCVWGKAVPDSGGSTCQGPERDVLGV